MTEPYIYDKTRVSAFCDAVFSIAITLLILDIDVPSATELSSQSFSNVLAQRTPNFIGFLVSFFVIALYWVAHLRIYKFIQKIDKSFIWLNIILLLFVVFLPFSTALYVGEFYATAPFIFYCVNLILLALSSYLLVCKVTKAAMGNHGMTPVLGKALKFRALNPLLIWTVAAILAPFYPLTARLIFILIFVVQAFSNAYFNKKLKL